MLREVFMMMPVGTVVLNGEYFYNGLIGAVWAIIAGPIGIHISNSKKLHQIKCLWNVYIPLISIGILCTISGFGLGVDSLLKNSNGIYIEYTETTTAETSTESFSRKFQSDTTTAETTNATTLLPTTLLYNRRDLHVTYSPVETPTQIVQVDPSTVKAFIGLLYIETIVLFG